MNARHALAALGLLLGLGIWPVKYQAQMAPVSSFGDCADSRRVDTVVRGNVDLAVTSTYPLGDLNNIRHREYLIPVAGTPALALIPAVVDVRADVKVPRVAARRVVACVANELPGDIRTSEQHRKPMCAYRFTGEIEFPVTKLVAIADESPALIGTTLVDLAPKSLEGFVVQHPRRIS